MPICKQCGEFFITPECENCMSFWQRLWYERPTYRSPHSESDTIGMLDDDRYFAEEEEETEQDVEQDAESEAEIDGGDDGDADSDGGDDSGDGN